MSQKSWSLMELKPELKIQTFTTLVNIMEKPTGISITFRSHLIFLCSPKIFDTEGSQLHPGTNQVTHVSNRHFINTVCMSFPSDRVAHNFFASCCFTTKHLNASCIRNVWYLQGCLFISWWNKRGWRLHWKISRASFSLVFLCWY